MNNLLIMEKDGFFFLENLKNYSMHPISVIEEKCQCSELQRQKLLYGLNIITFSN